MTEKDAEAQAALNNFAQAATRLINAASPPMSEQAAMLLEAGIVQHELALRLVVELAPVFQVACYLMEKLEGGQGGKKVRLFAVAASPVAGPEDSPQPN